MSQPWYREVSRQEWKTFLTTFAAWTLDSFDFTIITFVLTDIRRSFEVNLALAGALATVTPSQMGTSAAIADWTHLRIFKLKNRAAAEALGKGLDAATLRVVPDENQRKANSEKSATLRDFVRQEIWSSLK